MQGGQPPRGPHGPGQGIYVARRIVALVVILFLIVLVIPRACQALFGSEEQSSLSVPETTITSESTANGTENPVTEQETISDNHSSASEIKEESNADDTVYSGEESATPFYLEAPSNLAAVVKAPPTITSEDSTIEGVGTNRVAQLPDISNDQQQEVQPATNPTAVPANIPAGYQQEEQTQQVTNQSTPVLDISIEGKQPEVQPTTVEYLSATEEPISSQGPVLFEEEPASGATTTATAGATTAIASSGGAKAVAGDVVSSTPPKA